MQELSAWVGEAWPVLVSIVYVAGASWVTVDAVLRKRHVAAIVGWVGLAWFAPVSGAIAYFLLGINRVHRSANALQRRAAAELPQETRQLLAAAGRNAERAAAATDPGHPGLAGLARLGGRVTGRPLYEGNRVEPLVDGDAAYPAMLAAIEAAGRSVTLVSYIFDNDLAGHAFREALQRACARGVEVRVLLDDVGARYTKPTMVGELRSAGVPVAAFLPTRVPRLFQYANLRNHRKVMVVDGRVGFTGGMNIRAGHWRSRSPDDPVRCVHFRVDGPIVADMQQAFATDWAFTTGERLEGERWFSPASDCGPVVVRSVPDGPDDDIDNLPQLPWLLDAGCRVFRTPPPFDHSKLCVVDGTWSLVGSTNWDARSLRLNFEYNLECYDRGLAARLDAIIDDKIAGGRPMTRQELETRSFPARLRDGLARLLSPYL